MKKGDIVYYTFQGRSVVYSYLAEITYVGTNLYGVLYLGKNWDLDYIPKKYAIKIDNKLIKILYGV